MKYRRDIDGLRAVAVLPVVLYHAGVPGPSGGFVGVDIFFVISGFLITTIIATEIAEGRFSLVDFYERRARRILPALTAVIAATFLVGTVVLLPSELKALGQSALAATLFASNIYFNMTLDYFAQAAEFAPLLHTWSLAVEEQFYLFFPPLLMLLFAWRGARVAFWMVCGLSALSLLAAVVLLPLKPDMVFYQIFFRAWELGAGALLAMAARPAPSSRILRETLATAAFAAILVAIFFYTAQTPFPGLAALLPVLGAAALIHVGAKGGGSWVTTLLSHPAFVGIGLISYSLYLWHWPVLAYLRILEGVAHLPLWLGLAAALVSVALAWLSWRFVERPFRAKPPGGLGRPAIFGMSAAAMLAAIGVGGVLHQSGGLPARLPASAVAIANVAQDRNPMRADCINKIPDEGLCKIGAPDGAEGKAGFLLWGDSHADAIAPGIDQAAARLGQSGLYAAHRACPPVPAIQRQPEDRPCTRFNAAVADMLAQRSDLPLVILSARWPLSVEGTRYAVEGGGEIRIAMPEASESYTDNAAVFDAGLRQAVADILATGRQVVLLGPVPEVPWDVPAALSRNALLGVSDDKTFDAALHQTRVARSEEMLRAIAAEFDAVRYLPLSDLFCDPKVCAVTGPDGLPLYTDDDHVSSTAARSFLAQRLSDIWRPEAPTH